MPITGTPVNADAITVDKVRLFLRDRAENNILLDTVQFTQTEVDYAVQTALDMFNTMAPLTNYSIVDFPFKYLLILGAAKYLMLSESFLQVRNSVQANLGGETGVVGIDDKQAAYTGLYQVIRAEFEELAQRAKAQLNLEGIYNTMGSGYRHWYDR